jgi:hypothetical protein
MIIFVVYFIPVGQIKMLLKAAKKTFLSEDATMTHQIWGMQNRTFRLIMKTIL